MHKHSVKPLALATALAVAAGLSANAQAAPSVDEMWRIIQEQQAEIERLKQRVQSTDTKLEQTEVKVQATADAVEQGAAGGSKLARWVEKTSLGGYGELHYNNLENRNGSNDKNEIDLHRFVLFLGHEFNERTRFFSELEVEHALSGEGKEGEVELEQAYIEHDLTQTQRAKFGLFLVPVGILNETHEPDTFYGVERNPVENNIIPSTWWEAGVALNGELARGLSYDAAVTSGLGLDEDEWKVRDGRQKVSEAKADTLAYTGRIKYTGIAGLELAATLQYQEDVYQERLFLAGQRQKVEGWLWEAHAAYQKGPFGLRALYAEWQFDDAIEQVELGADRQKGWYVEPSWRFNEQWGIFARYNEWDNQAGSGLVDSEYSQVDFGVNYWLAPTVVLKADWQDQDAPSGQKELDGFNLGVGWSF